MAGSTKKPDGPALPATLDLFTQRHAAPQQKPTRAEALGPPAAKQQDYVAPQQQDVAPQQRSAPAAPRVYRIAEIVRLAGRSLEARFPEVWVEGEISNLRVPGHCYFTLKDAEAQLPVVMWRSEVARLRFRLADGLQVRARGRLSIYEAQGKFQLYADAVEPAGLGSLQLAFEQLKRRLAGEGLFAPERKRALPFLPRRIGVATSPTGAAVRDIVRVALRRGPARILVAPCQVQGEAAPAEIVRAIGWLERQPDVDLIIVGRGGGSIEDLWAFNDEAVARAIAACRVPVISAVGHEVDFTIADFVADVRAATPSQAAELAVPVHAELARGLAELETRLGRVGRRTLAQARQRLDDEVERAQSLLERTLHARRHALDTLGRRLVALHPRARLERDRGALQRMSTRLERPLAARLADSRQALERLRRRLDAAMQQTLARRHRGFEAACGKLDALSPLRVLERGYGLVRGPGGEVLQRSSQVAPGDVVTVRLAHGAFGARVETVDPEDGS